MWIVPREDAALALVIGHAASGRRLHAELRKVGVDAAELDAAKAAIVEALAAGPLAPTALQRDLPPGAVRSLGAAGKALGLSTTLPPALRLLEAEGRIRRVAPDHRLDTERWSWALAPEGWLDLASIPDDPVDQAAELVARFLSWAAPASRGEIAAWSKLGQGVLRQAIARVGAVEVDVASVGPALVLPAHLGETLVDDERVFLVDSTDNLVALRARPAPLVDAAFHDLELPSMGRARSQRLADATWAAPRAVVQRGALIGLWDWDPDTAEIVLAPFAPWPPGVARRAEAAAADLVPLIRDELDGEARTFSLDGPPQQRARVAWIRALAEG